MLRYLIGLWIVYYEIPDQLYAVLVLNRHRKGYFWKMQSVHFQLNNDNIARKIPYYCSTYPTIPANTQRNKYVIITLKRRFDVINTRLLRFVFAGMGGVFREWWRHQMETFAGNSPVIGEVTAKKGQWRRALVFSLIYARIKAWCPSHGLFPGCSRVVLNKNCTSTHGARTGPVRRRTILPPRTGTVEF